MVAGSLMLSLGTALIDEYNHLTNYAECASVTGARRSYISHKARVDCSLARDLLTKGKLRLDEAKSITLSVTSGDKRSMVSRMCRERGEDQGGDIEAFPTVSPKPLIACRSLVASDASKYVFLCQRRQNSRQVDGLCSGANPRAAEDASTSSFCSPSSSCTPSSSEKRRCNIGKRKTDGNINHER